MSHLSSSYMFLPPTCVVSLSALLPFSFIRDNLVSIFGSLLSRERDRMRSDNLYGQLSRLSWPQALSPYSVRQTRQVRSYRWLTSLVPALHH